MLFAEDWATPLLVLHVVLAATLVAVTTHLVVWMRGYVRGRFHRHRGVRKFALYAACLYVATFLVGNVIYPLYKVRVRGAYLDDPAAIRGDLENRSAARERAMERQARHLRTEGRRVPDVLESEPPPVGDARTAGEAASIARWFDVKEHWVAMGMALSIALAVIIRFWNPNRAGAEIAPIVFLMAIGAAGAAWLGAIIGVIVASYRAVG